MELAHIIAEFTAPFLAAFLSAVGVAITLSRKGSYNEGKRAAEALALTTAFAEEKAGRHAMEEKLFNKLEEVRKEAMLAATSNRPCPELSQIVELKVTIGAQGTEITAMRGRIHDLGNRIAESMALLSQHLADKTRQ